ncbi:MAG: trimeric intracellular cation channel family protein [Clostridia bacterium]|nr:trimeric intracellular cation channel family protein [Clostridia bacterium]
MTEIIKIMEIIGTIAFALSGSLVAISSGLDVFGVAFLACITAFGGGILRDMILGINPPLIFNNFSVFLLALIVAILTFIVSYVFRSKFNNFKTKIERINNIFDAIGLSAFVVIGSETACVNGFLDNGFIVVFVGMITGVGGGIFRDILIDTTPYVFKKHIYAIAAILGGIVYFILRKYIQNIQLSSFLSILLIFTIRMLATKYRWSLPKIYINDNNDN